MASQHTGKIMELNERNGGLIKEAGVKEDLFFHADALEGITFGELKKGDKVSYHITQSNKGPYAVNVRKA
jgi:CspA family cold shock protein